MKNCFVYDFKGHDTDKWIDYDEDNVPFGRLQKVYVPNEDSLEQRMNIFHGQLWGKPEYEIIMWLRLALNNRQS